MVGRRLAGAGVLVGATLLWSVAEGLTGVLSRRYSLIEIIWMRYSIHLALMLVLWTPGGPARLLRARHPGWQMVRGLTMLVASTCLVVALYRLSHPVIMSLFWITPLLAMGLAAAWLGERPGRRRWVAAAGAYAGGLVLLGPVAIPFSSAVILPLSTAACFALYLVLTRFMREETSGSRLFYTALGVWVPLTVIVPRVWKTPSARDLGIMTAIGVLGFLLLLGFDLALDAAPVGQVAPFLLAQPIWSLLLEAVLTGHGLSRHALAGAVTILGAWLVFAWPEARRPSSRSE
jgi:drug/metabolite transporter (DMT)-like permease